MDRTVLFAIVMGLEKRRGQGAVQCWWGPHACRKQAGSEDGQGVKKMRLCFEYGDSDFLHIFHSQHF